MCCGLRLKTRFPWQGNKKTESVPRLINGAHFLLWGFSAFLLQRYNNTFTLASIWPFCYAVMFQYYVPAYRHRLRRGNQQNSVSHGDIYKYRPSIRRPTFVGVRYTYQLRLILIWMAFLIGSSLMMTR